jgi:hypothetical protein
MDDCLVKLVKPIVDTARTKIWSWHYLWEGRPWPLTLRLRFFGEDKEIGQLRQLLDEKLKDISHCYGEHGDCGEGKEYKGEADGNDGWGSKAWEAGMKFLQMGSEFALELVDNKNKLGNSKEYKKSAVHYADRYTHLFLNQISSLLDEVDFDLKEGFSRFALRVVRKTKPSLPDDKILSATGPLVHQTIEESKHELQEKVEALARAKQ